MDIRFIEVEGDDLAIEVEESDLMLLDTRHAYVPSHPNDARGGACSPSSSCTSCP